MAQAKARKSGATPHVEPRANATKSSKPGTKAKAAPRTTPRAKLPAVAGHGGSRPNSGRKPCEATAVIADLNAATLGLVSDWVPGLLHNLKKLADGICVKDEHEDGSVEYFTAPPNFKANEYLVNRVLGRPTDRQEVSGPEGTPIPVAIVAAIDKVYGGSAE